jgi:hypothetical protein
MNTLLKRIEKVEQTCKVKPGEQPVIFVSFVSKRLSSIAAAVCDGERFQRHADEGEEAFMLRIKSMVLSKVGNKISAKLVFLLTE